MITPRTRASQAPTHFIAFACLEFKRWTLIVLECKAAQLPQAWSFYQKCYTFILYLLFESSHFYTERPTLTMNENDHTGRTILLFVEMKIHFK